MYHHNAFLSSSKQKELDTLVSSKTWNISYCGQSNNSQVWCVHSWDIREIKQDVTSNGKRQKWDFCRLSSALCAVEWKYLYLWWPVGDMFLFLCGLFKNYKNRKKKSLVIFAVCRLPETSCLNFLLFLALQHKFQIFSLTGFIPYICIIDIYQERWTCISITSKIVAGLNKRSTVSQWEKG